jgi:hypothetical protein
MKKIIVNEEIDVIKELLKPIKDQVCIVHHRQKKESYIVTYDSNIDFVKNRFSVLSLIDFTENERMDFVLSDEDILITGREDFLK